MFNGVNMHLGSIMKLSNAETRSITAENVYGEKGKGGMAEVSETPQPEVVRIGQQWDGPNTVAKNLGQGWKVRPCITLPAETTTTIMDVAGPGSIQHFWCTVEPVRLRHLILRMYWDEEATPSVEVPLGDFFCNGWKVGIDWKPVNINALPINVNPRGGFNCFFPMPFRTHARVTIENLSPLEAKAASSTPSTTLSPRWRWTMPTSTPSSAAPTRCRTKRPIPSSTVCVARGNTSAPIWPGSRITAGWWGEGEFKAYLDGDTDFPTICGTGTEDYFGGAWGFGETFSAPFMGYPCGSPPSDKVPAGAPPRPLSLSHHGPHPLPAGYPRHHASPRLAQRGPWLPAAAGRHRLGRLLVPGRTARAFPTLPERDALEVIRPLETTPRPA